MYSTAITRLVRVRVGVRVRVSFSFSFFPSFIIYSICMIVNLLLSS